VQKQARLPGFRKGHVPRSLVKLHFADDVRREVAEHLIPDLYRQAVSEAQLEPVDEPDLTDVHLEENAPLTFKAVVEIRPVIALGEYKDLEVQHAPSAVTDDNVETALGQMREHHAELRSVERPAAPGDVVIVDYTLSPEGLPPNSESGYAFQVGEGTVLPEIDQVVVGMSAGEEREVGVRFSAEHRREELRDKAGRAAVKVVEVKEKVLPALDDDFAKQVGEFDTGGRARQLRRQPGPPDRDHAALEARSSSRWPRHEFPVPDLLSRQVAPPAPVSGCAAGIDPTAPWDYPSWWRPAAHERSARTPCSSPPPSMLPRDAEVDAESRSWPRPAGGPPPRSGV
jgi:FKBP-type peptidyl-prolyl cis-trans isomerase 2